MYIKLLQLNIFKGKLYEQIINLVKSEHFDIVQFQEVTGGKKSNGGVYNHQAKLGIAPGEKNKQTVGVDLFEKLKQDLNMNGELAVVHRLKNDNNSYEGNATYFKKDISCQETKIVWLKEYMEVEESFNDWSIISRAALSLRLSYLNTEFYVLNTHMAWGPTSFDADYKIKQAQILQDYISTLYKPFVLTGDFNVTPNTQTASIFNKLGRNLITENHISNTLNFNIHPAKQLLPNGIAVDYIYTSPELKIHDFRVITTPDLSDHYGLAVELEI